MKIYMVAENWVDDCEPGYRISVWHDFESAWTEFEKVAQKNKEQAQKDDWVEDDYKKPTDGGEYASYVAYLNGDYAFNHVEVEFRCVEVGGTMSPSTMASIADEYELSCREEDVRNFIGENPEYRDVDVPLAASKIDKKLYLTDSYSEIYWDCVRESVEEALNEDRPGADAEKERD